MPSAIPLGESAHRFIRMIFLGFFIAAAAAGTLGVGVVGAAPGAVTSVPKVSIWAGSVVQDASAANVRGAFGTWTVPTVKCRGTPNALSYTWVGIGGVTAIKESAGGSSGDDETLYQTGTEADCDNGQAEYSAFVEEYGVSNRVSRQSQDARGIGDAPRLFRSIRGFDNRGRGRAQCVHPLDTDG